LQPAKALRHFLACREVQTWIRRDALRETNRDSRSHDQRLLLFFDAGELVAVAGHGRFARGGCRIGRGQDRR
jgi:hypothetical protein